MSEDKASTAPKRDLKKLMGFAFAGLNVAVLGAGLFLVFESTLGVQHKATSNEMVERELATFEDSLHGDPVLFAMAPFNTNLDGVPRRLIRLDLSLEMQDEEGFEEIIGLTPQARDSIMRLLSGKSFGDLETVQGKLHLKNQIIAGLNTTLKKGVVKNVYFNELVVQ